MRLAYKPEPPLRRLWHVFRPARPQTPVRPWTAPPWSGPPDSELGVAVPLREILVSDPRVVIALVDCVAFSNGFEFWIAVRSREDIDSRQMGFGPPHPGGSEPEKGLQLGVQFADGRAAATGEHPSREWMAQMKMHAEGREPGLGDGPILGPMSAGGGGKRWDFRYWVWPLPPPGKLTFTCEWPSRSLALTAHEVDASEIRRAGSASTTVWGDT